MLCGIKIGTLVCNKKMGVAMLVFQQETLEIGLFLDIFWKKKVKKNSSEDANILWACSEKCM